MVIKASAVIRENQLHSNQAAQVFHDWAASQAMLADGPLSPVVHGAATFDVIQPITESGLTVLRAKQIQSIAFDVEGRKVVVFTKRALPVSKKVRQSLPQTIDDIEIVYRQGLQTPVGGSPSMPHGDPTYRVRHVGSTDFYTCGSSISVGNYREAGTLGCLVRDAAGEIYGLSNNHVSGSCNFASVGLPIVGPGICDVAANNLPPFTIGFHVKSLPMVAGSPDNVDPIGNRDAAVFRIATSANVSSYQGNAYDTPTSIAIMSGGMAVEKVGRTTGHTRGVVVGQLHGALTIPYAAALYGFNGPVSFNPVFAIAGVGDLFSDNGDSGALITSVDPAGNRVAVGLVFAGMTDGSAPGGKLTLALPIGNTLQELGVTLVAGHNV
jgi:hypothetical protein